MKLELGQVSEAISVEANAIQVNTADAQKARSISMREINTLPQLGRGPLALAALTPGVSVDAGDQSFSRVNGLRQGSNNTRLDGIDVNDNVVPRFGLALTPSNTDSVEEVRIITNGGKAEFGRSAGAQIEMVTRSGTNQFHGNAFEFLRNSKLNSNTFFNNAASTARPKFNQSIYGGSFGGPAIKNKVFFFGNFQGTDSRQDVSRNRTVATSEAKQGIFRWRDSAGNIQSFDIARNDPAGRGVDSPMRNIFNLTLPANNTEVGDGLNTAGHRLNIAAPAKSYQGTGKVDWQMTPLHRIFFRYSKLKAETVDNLNNAERTFPSQKDSAILNDRYGFSIGSDWTLSPNLINEFRAGRQFGLTQFLRPDRPSGPAVFTVLFTDPINTAFGQHRNTPVNDFTDNLTILRGKHTLKTGVNFRHVKQFAENFAGIYPNVNLARVNGNIAPAALGPRLGKAESPPPCASNLKVFITRCSGALDRLTLPSTAIWLSFSKPACRASATLTTRNSAHFSRMTGRSSRT
ncbi:MAG: TonB-dependent receptor [Acidobacteria bacterium]|nr:TonB-dependent receptor [Acidobacteriota bacterium]